MNGMKLIVRVCALYVLPACFGSQFFFAHATKVLKVGTTTTYNGLPACDCGTNSGQCGCIISQ
jgi:hypothetical protein